MAGAAPNLGIGSRGGSILQVAPVGSSVSRHRGAEIELGRALFTDLYEEYYDGIVRYIFVRIGDQTEAEDLAGEVFLKALNSYRDELSVEETVETKLQVERLCKALRQLTPSQREVIGLRFFVS
jgi:DNA-directed RNA polymerase specialized sigma24 family protein